MFENLKAFIWLVLEMIVPTLFGIGFLYFAILDGTLCAVYTVSFISPIVIALYKIEKNRMAAMTSPEGRVFNPKAVDELVELLKEQQRKKRRRRFW